MKLHCFVSVLSAFFFVNKAKCFLVCILWSCFFFGCSVFNFCFLLVFYSFQKERPKNPDTAENPKNKKVRGVVFTNSFSNLFGVEQKMALFCWKPYKIVVWAHFEKFEKGKNGQKMTKRLSQISVQGWVKNLSKYVAQHNWTDFDSKKWYFVSSIFFLSHSPCRKKNVFEKQKRKKEETLDRFLTQKNQFLDRFLTLQIYIYICCGVIIWATFGVFYGY